MEGGMKGGEERGRWREGGRRREEGGREGRWYVGGYGERGVVVVGMELS